MKYLTLPVFLGIVGLSLLSAEPAGAQGSFSSSSMPNADPFRGTRANPSSIAPAAPAAQQAAGVPTASAYGSSGYDMGRSGFAGLMTSSEPIDPNHKLGRGDRLSYRIREDKDLVPPPPLIVTDSGEVDVPLLGRVKAVGKTPDQLASDIKSQLEREYYKPGHATVIMGLDAVAPKLSKGRVDVQGAVVRQGTVEIPVDEPLTVSKAIIRSGGFKDFANQSKVIVLRAGGPAKGIIVNMKSVNNGQLDQDALLQPGDTIIVKEKWINF